MKKNTSKIQVKYKTTTATTKKQKRNTHTSKNMVSVSKSMHFDKLDVIVNKHIH